MIKNLELLQPGSCLNKAAPDEPIFVLRAKDTLAPQTIRHWATMAFGIHEKEKIADAELLASAMEDWYKQNFPTCANDA
jgi:hypothetical protein